MISILGLVFLVHFLLLLITSFKGHMLSTSENDCMGFRTRNILTVINKRSYE